MDTSPYVVRIHPARFAREDNSEKEQLRRQCVARSPRTMAPMSSTHPEIFPFILGCGRSGTTLLRAIFDSHAAMAIPHESYFITKLAGRRRRYERNGGFDTDRFTRDLVGHSWFHRWGLNPEDVRGAFRRERPADFPGAVRSVFSLYAAVHDKPRYGDKTPMYVLHIPLLAGLFPEARFVHIVRDGRDVAMSLLEQEWGSNSVVEAALFWRRRVVKGRRDGSALGPGRYTEVRYEDLVEQPETVVAQLCDFMCLKFEPEMFQYFERAGEIVEGAAFPHRHARINLPPTKGLRDWRRQMTAADIATFSALAGDTLDDFGYERGALPSARVRASAYARAAGATMLRMTGHRRIRRELRHLRRRVQRVEDT